MTTKADYVWDLIRSADPMNSLDVTGAATAPDVQDLLRRITIDDPTVLPDSDQTVHVLPVLDRALERTDRRRRPVAGRPAAAVVVVLLVAAVTTVWRQHRGGSTLAPERQTTAAGYSKALLAELPLPTGARSVAAAPIPELRQAPYTGHGILDARVAWWAVPTSFRAAVAAFNRRPLPVHWKISASATGGAGPSSNGWDIEVRDPRARFVASLTVVIAAQGNVTGLLVQVDTFAIPVRTPAQIIPPSADSVTFTITGLGRAEYGGFSGARVAVLARQINAAPTFVLLTEISCPGPTRSMTVAFHNGSRRWSLKINDGSFLCNTPSLTGSSGTPIDLTPSAGLLKDVLAAAALPSNYLTR